MVVFHGESRVTTPSLRKYNDNVMDRRRQTPSFSIGHILGDPFALATISLAILAWLIALVGGILSQTHQSYAVSPGAPGGNYPNFLWWTTAFMFTVIVGVIAAVSAAAADVYQGAIVGFLAIGFVYSTSAVSSLVYQSGHSEEAAAAGFILLSIIVAIWMFYFGSNPQAAHRGYIDSFALHKDQRQSMMGLGNSRPISTNPLGGSGATARGFPPNSGMGPGSSQTPTIPPQMYTSNQLAGFETSSPVSGYPGGAVGGMRSPGPRSPALGGGFAPSHEGGPYGGMQQGPGIMGGEGMGGTPVSGQVEYPYRAKAIYSYDANPSDPNEISFSKHEILEVSDVSGRWWQAKKESGETGIAPSNYLILL